ncbi:hypothetical protein HYV85_05250 [Candidatus Woesearchaeota archaeon]|nr:hypothetical protein [Candidatus Woesearchaeota archaeon]
MKKRFLEAVATLVGTTIGAGVLGIPYVVAKSGLAVGLLHIIIIGAAVMLVNLLLGEVVLRTKGNHQLTGYAEKYLGKNGKRLMALAMVFGIYGALLAYIIGAGNALNAINPQLTPFFWSIIFFAAASAIVYFGLKAVEESELLLSFLTIAVISIIIVVAANSGRFSAANFTGTSIQNLFVPYGVVLFAFLGAVAIPEMREELGSGKARKLLKRAIILGGLVPIVLYSLFAVAVVGISGAATGQLATVTIGKMLGERMILFANLFAVLAMSTSFIALGLALKEMYVYDYRLKRKTAWALTCFIPLLAFLLGLKNFIAVLGVAGAVAGGIEGILLVAMHIAAKKKKAEVKPEYAINMPRLVAIALAFMFLFGIIYAVITAAKAIAG